MQQAVPVLTCPSRKHTTGCTSADIFPCKHTTGYTCADMSLMQAYNRLYLLPDSPIIKRGTRKAREFPVIKTYNNLAIYWLMQQEQKTAESTEISRERKNLSLTFCSASKLKLPETHPRQLISSVTGSFTVDRSTLRLSIGFRASDPQSVVPTNVQGSPAVHSSGRVPGWAAAVARIVQIGPCPVRRRKADDEEQTSDPQKDDPTFVPVRSLREN